MLMHVRNAQFSRFIRKCSLQQDYTERTRREEYIIKIIRSVIDKDSRKVINSVGEHERNSVDSCVFLL